MASAELLAARALRKAGPNAEALEYDRRTPLDDARAALVAARQAGTALFH